MAKALIVYYSETGNTEKMAKAVANGISSVGVDIVVKRVEEVGDFDAILLGSQTRWLT